MTVEELKQSFFDELPHVTEAKPLEELRIKYLGRERGMLTKILRSLKDLSSEEKRRVGPAANALRDEMESALAGKLKELQAVASVESDIDITRPGVKIEHGHLHPLTLVGEEIKRIFRQLHFSVVEGPEVETEYHNFDSLNIPKHHPARDVHDTFWLKQHGEDERDPVKRLLLRTHISALQVKYMSEHTPPFQFVAPGRVFRYEASDFSHNMQFEYLEGVMVGKDVSLANFKFVVETFFSKLFGRKIEFRYRPSYFPFVEPGVEVDAKLAGGWLELGGAGMVHPKVFEAAGYVPGEWQGFAFGFGIDRLAMIKYKIPDVRLFYSGDIRFISQF